MRRGWTWPCSNWSTAGTAEPLSQNGVFFIFKNEQKCTGRWEWGKKKRKQQKVKEGTVGRAAPGLRAEKSPVVHRGTALEQVLPCSPWRTKVEHRPARKPMEVPMLNQLNNSWTPACGKGSQLEQFVKDCGPWRDGPSLNRETVRKQHWQERDEELCLVDCDPHFSPPCTAWGRVQGSGTKLSLGKGEAESAALVFLSLFLITRIFFNWWLNYFSTTWVCFAIVVAGK